MRRNILTYKAPPGNEGYDLVCIHPDPQRRSRAIHVQVKSRYAADCDRAFPVKARTFAAFDYLVIAFLNIGSFYPHRRTAADLEPEFYTLPRRFVAEHHDSSSCWGRVRLRGMDESVRPFRNYDGFEQIARDLGIPYPARDAS